MDVVTAAIAAAQTRAQLKPPLDDLADFAPAGQVDHWTRFVPGPISATPTLPLVVFIAPYPCRMIGASVIIPDSGGSITANATNRWAFDIRRYRGTTTLPVPADSANGAAAGNIATKSTSVTGITARFALRIAEQEMDPTNRIFRAGEMGALVLTKSGTASDILNLHIQFSTERI